MGYVNSHSSITNSPRKLYYCICPSSLKTTFCNHIFLSTFLKIQRQAYAIFCNLFVVCLYLGFFYFTHCHSACVHLSGQYFVVKKIMYFLWLCTWNISKDKKIFRVITKVCILKQSGIRMLCQ